MSLQMQGPDHQNLPTNTKSDKHVRVKNQQNKMVDLIDSFYSKAKTKIEKALTKDNKKTTLLCQEIFRALAYHPRQELYEISRLNDTFFNQIASIMNTVSDLLKNMESLVFKLGSQLNIIKQRSLKKQQRELQKEKKIVVLRKIQFKKEKNSLATKLKNIDLINKKLIKFEDNKDQNSTSCVMDIEGKRVETKLVKWNKIYFSSKNRQYLLCTVEKSENTGQLLLMNDKLQTIANFNKVPPINLSTLVNIVQVQDYIYIVHSHRIFRSNLLNQDDQLEELSKQRIILAQSNSSQLIVWIKDENSLISVVFMTLDMQNFYAQKLAFSSKTISHCCKLKQQGKELIYFISRSASGSNQLWAIQNQQTKLISKTIGVIDEIINLQNKQVIFRRGHELFRFDNGQASKRLFQIQTETVEYIQKCCIIGQHLYCLHQSGKYMLQCHFCCQQTDQNPQ